MIDCFSLESLLKSIAVSTVGLKGLKFSLGSYVIISDFVYWVFYTGEPKFWKTVTREGLYVSVVDFMTNLFFLMGKLN